MADFSEVPNIVVSRPPVFNVEITEGVSYKQTTYKEDNNTLEVFELHFGDVTAAKRTTLKDHFKGQFAHYNSFSWTNPPSYVNSGVAFTVRYMPEEGYQEDTPQVGGNVFTIMLVFLKVVT